MFIGKFYYLSVLVNVVVNEYLKLLFKNELPSVSRKILNRLNRSIQLHFYLIDRQLIVSFWIKRVVKLQLSLSNKLSLHLTVSWLKMYILPI